MQTLSFQFIHRGHHSFSMFGVTGRFLLQVTGHLLAVSSHHGLLSTVVSFFSRLLAVSFYLLVRATVTYDL